MECVEYGWAMLGWVDERADNDELRAQYLAILNRVRRIDSLLDHLDGCLQGLEDVLTESRSGPQQTSFAAKPPCARKRSRPAPAPTALLDRRHLTSDAPGRGVREV
ncbi:hypothetical protein [Actinopolymorpha pittospori]|uniref:Uncharacterized protein n=1 Tax=Actinopolymorpha pittospori TaxID=648752 RepID=A0A927MXC6_9ACTN|nr:hypothetical protein [Actinopolymorpha pittospori]MBE1608024.1 hypothetical protein [Actinopolymorpha pittospori]